MPPSTGALCVQYSPAAPQLDNQCVKLYENLTGTRRVSQDIQVSGVAGDTFVLSGWAIGYSVPLGVKQECHRRFGMVLNFVKDGSVVEPHEVNFEPSIDQWQYASGVIVAGQDFDSIDILGKGSFAYYNSAYQRFLKKVRANPVPNVAYRRMDHFHTAVTAYHQASRFRKRFMMSPVVAWGVY